jgi:dTDP-4-dehydrorhamnose 3,5-epimerase
MAHRYVPDAVNAVRWDDPTFAIQWPREPPEGRIISQRDRTHPDFQL